MEKKSISIFCVEANTKCRKFVHFALASVQNVEISAFCIFNKTMILLTKKKHWRKLHNQYFIDLKLKQMTFYFFFLLYFRENKSWHFM